MEEAYTSLYQEFLRLRAICLKQATMLQHLTEALNNSGVNGDSDNTVSMPVQCTQDDLINFCSDAHELVFRRHPGNQSSDPNRAHGGGGVTADLLTSGIDQLHLTPFQPQTLPLGPGPGPGAGPGPGPGAGAGGGAGALPGAGAHAGAVPVLEGPWSPPAGAPAQRAPPSIIEDLRRAEQQWAEDNPTRARKPWSCSSFLDSEWQSLTGGRVMSRVTKVTRVCEFCQAVFPGHTTTRGDFLRHLTSHIT